MHVLVAGTVAAFVMFVLIWAPLTLSQRTVSVKRRVALHVERPRAAAEERAGLRARLEGPFDATQTRLGDTRPWKALESLVERAGLPWRTVEVFYMVAGSALAVALVAATAGAAAPLAALLAVATLLCARLALGIVIARRMRAFEEQLPDVLGAIASALRAGHSFTQALQAVAAEIEEPSRAEFERVLAETRLGRSIDDALGDLGARIASRELDFVLAAVSIQRQVGGSIAGLFETVAETVRTRQQFARKIRGLTATGRASAFVVCILPIGLGILLTSMNPSYMAPLYSTALGRSLLGAAACLMTIGSLWLRKIVSFRG
jgi:tight adherence protein B